jgi:hypothetical protein
LRKAGVAAGDAGELGRNEGSPAVPAFGEQRTQVVLGIAVGGRGVDERGTTLEEPFHHFLERLVLGAVRGNLEAARGTHADDRHCFAG